ncbi:Auxin response factor 1 [Linum grandiflorum]
MMLGRTNRMIIGSLDQVQAPLINPSYTAGHRRHASAHLTRKRSIQRRSPPTHANKPQTISQPGDEDGLLEELWQACAGPLAYVPKIGEYVYYFLQGHIQQVKSCIEQDCEMELPQGNSVPYKLLCKVVDVQRKAEAVTDEVFARIVLLPVLEEVISSSSWKEDDEDDGGISNNSDQSWNKVMIRSKKSKRSFSKKLTPSDTSKHGGFSVPRRQAEECLPALNMSEEPPVQEIAAKDIHNNLWRFRHIYRGDPKRHLLTSGWSTFATSKRISPGDQFIFVRGENGQLRVGVRRGGRQQQQQKKPLPPSATVISANCILHGILADASHAVTTGSTFVVYYRPWSNSSEFLVPAGRYLKSTKLEYSPGTRFKMLFEGDECTEQRIERFEGTIVGNDPVDPLHWHDSEWERLKSLNLEAFHEPSKKRNTQQQLPELPDPKSPITIPHWLKLYSATSAKPDPPPNQQSLGQGQDEVGLTEVNHDGPSPTAPPAWPVGLPSGDKYYSSSSSSSSQEKKEEDDRNEALLASPPRHHEVDKRKCMVFGVNILSKITETEFPSPQIVTVTSEDVSETSFSDSDGLVVPLTSQHSSGGGSETISYNPATIPPHGTTNCSIVIKVLKQGSQLGRLVDLARFNGHDQLVRELDRMFGFHGSLVDGSSGWHVTFVDAADSHDSTSEIMQLMGVAHKLYICPTERN